MLKVSVLGVLCYQWLGQVAADPQSIGLTVNSITSVGFIVSLRVAQLVASAFSAGRVLLVRSFIAS